jgi:hypothetical protein
MLPLKVRNAEQHFLNIAAISENMRWYEDLNLAECLDFLPEE